MIEKMIGKVEKVIDSNYVTEKIKKTLENIVEKTIEKRDVW